MGVASKISIRNEDRGDFKVEGSGVNDHSGSEKSQNWAPEQQAAYYAQFQQEVYCQHQLQLSRLD